MSELTAFVVGIEGYDQPGWDVSGPCLNAARMAECLLDMFGEGADVQLFVNFSKDDAELQTKPKQEAVERLKARGVTVQDHAFNRDALDTAFRKLRDRKGRLLLYWSGHGYSDGTGNRILVCPDFRSDGFANRVFDATRRFDWLHSNEFSGLSEQILLMDVCAKSTKIKFEADSVGSSSRVLSIQQIGVFAAQEGTYAYIGRESFTDILLATFRSFAKWPDPKTCYDLVRESARAAECEPFIMSGFARHDQFKEEYVGKQKAAGHGKTPPAAPIVANYVAARSALDDFVAPVCSERILLIRGDSGFGKSYLVTDRAPLFLKEVRHVGVKLSKRSDITELLTSIAGTVGHQSLPTFATALRALLPPLQIQVSAALPFGWQDEIKGAIIRGGTSKVAALIDCLFEDFSKLPEPLLIILDGFEPIPPQLRALIEDHFLACVARTPNIRVIVLGRKIPDKNHVAWGHCCAPVCDLKGVSKVTDWMPVVAALGRRIDAEYPETHLGAICQYLKGRPNKIMEYIQGLPKET